LSPSLHARLSAFVKTAFPEIEIRSTRLATNGWDNDVLIVNDEYVFRFPSDPLALRNAVAVPEHRSRKGGSALSGTAGREIQLRLNAHRSTLPA
jgi:hypothetical protein